MRVKTDRQVFYFGPSRVDGNAGMRRQLGGKGANLAEMARIGLPIPPGFTIGTRSCLDYLHAGGQLPGRLRKAIDKALRRLEKDSRRRFADPDNPLLLSVRSGAAVSMPGMMDTVLNLGLNDDIVEALGRRNHSRRFALDAYRRLIGMFGDVVMQVPHDDFEQALRACRRQHGATTDAELEDMALEKLIREYMAIYRRHTGEDFPQDPYQQLLRAIEAVFRSWNTPRAVSYRRIHAIGEDLGTAVNVQMMVFGNLGEDSATGVAFTRNPATGANAFYGEFLVNAQGEDVVAGIRTPRPMAALKDWNRKVFKQLLKVKKTLESHYRDMQDIEFTIQEGRLWMLQTRTGKRTGTAALNMAMDMLAEGLIDEATAVLRVRPDQLDELLHPLVDPEAERRHAPIARGLPAGPGGAVGRIVFTADDAVRWAADGERVILVREETNPEDVEGMRAAAGILTARGGMTSHAALVARGWGKCCVVGAGGLEIDLEARTLRAGDTVLREGDVVTLNGTRGLVYVGELPMIDATENPRFREFMALADRFRTLGVRTNADTPEDARTALEFGAEGIGLFRTEHMFYGAGSEEPLFLLRKVIVAQDEAERRAALEELYPHVKRDIKATLEVMAPRPVTIRLLDPPLHEFVPHGREERERLAEALGITVEALDRRADELAEANPMMGHRGVRLGVTFPEVSEMQFRAILEAAAELAQEGKRVRPEIMIPVVALSRELELQLELLRAVHDEVAARYGVERIEHLFGTMIEIPRACLTADELARVAEFFSFGTNDLTQMTFAFSRDDIGGFVPDYLERGVLAADPFQVLDREGVGQLVRIGIERGRSARPGLKVGICGEHGGEPSSVEFCHLVGMDYVSCSPYRVPIARLAAAQAAIRHPRREE